MLSLGNIAVRTLELTSWLGDLCQNWESLKGDWETKQLCSIFIWNIIFIFKILVASGASLYEENKNGETACDCAIKGNFNDIASFLESRMVFSVSMDHVSKLKKSSTNATHVSDETGKEFNTYRKKEKLFNPWFKF